MALFTGRKRRGENYEENLIKVRYRETALPRAKIFIVIRTRSTFYVTFGTAVRQEAAVPRAFRFQLVSNRATG